MPGARFEAIALDQALIWKYRGQVLPSNAEVISELEVTSIEQDDHGLLVRADGSLWADQLRIYEVKNLAMRVVSNTPPKHDIVLDLHSAPWLKDHRPTYTVPALPMMSALDYLAGAVQSMGPKIVSLHDVHMHRWVVVDTAPVRLRVAIKPISDNDVKTQLLMTEDESIVTSARVRTADDYPPAPPALPALQAAEISDDLYQTGTLFHGPSFQLLRQLRRNAAGSSALVDAGAGGLPDGTLNPALLDALLHGIPHDTPEIWFGKDAEGLVAYPYRIDQLSLHTRTPRSGLVRVESRILGEMSRGLISIHVQAIVDDTVWLDMRITEVLLPKGPLGSLAAPARRAFLRDRRPTEDAVMSRFIDETSVLEEAVVKASNWLPGTLESVYGYAGTPAELTRAIAAKEHCARRLGRHPGAITLCGDTAIANQLPLNPVHLQVDTSDGVVRVTDAGTAELDPTPVLEDWRARIGVAAWPVEQIYFSLVRRFINQVIIDDAGALSAVKGRPCLFLANHQVGLESLLFALIGAHFNDRSIVTIAKQEHRETWMGKLIALCSGYPGIDLPRSIMFFDRNAQNSMLDLVGSLKAILYSEGASLMVHAEGTRSLQCRQPVKQLSAVFLDFAVAGNLPIVPVRFAGGLPFTGGTERLEFPVGFGKQDFYLGQPILPETLAPLPLKDRKEWVLGALNGLGPDLAAEVPHPSQVDFARQVAEMVTHTGMEATRAAILCTLATDPEIGDDLRGLVRALESGTTYTPSASAKSHWLAHLAAWFTES